MTDIVLDEIGSGYNLSKMNDNFQKIETSLNEDKLSTTGGNNTMQQALDMNNQRILNLGEPKSPTDPLRLGDIERINNTAVGANIVTQTADEVPTTGVLNGVKWYIIDTAQTFVYVVENGETTGQWVEEDQIGDDIDITVVRQLTLAETQAEDLKVGQYVRLEDFNMALYKVVDVGDTGGVYKPLNATTKLKLVYDSLFINNKAVDDAEYNLSIFGGALRRTPFSGSNRWEHITDSAHEPYGVSATVDDVDDYQFRIHYSNAAGENVKVGTTLFSLDYDLAPYGIMTGASGDINSSIYQMFAPCVLYINGATSVTASPLWTSNGLGITTTPAQYIISHPPRALTVDPPMLSTIVTQAGSRHSALYELSWGATQTTITAKDTLAGYISCDGVNASVSLSRNLNLAATVADGIITVTHDNVAGSYVSQVSPLGSDAYTPHVVSVTDTTVQVGFKDETGTIVTAPSNKMKFMFSRNALVTSLIDPGVRFGLDLGLCRVKNQDVGNVSLNNFWYIGFNNV